MPLWKRSLTVAAGPGANFVFSILAFALAAFVAGRDITDYTQVAPRIGGVEASSPAANAGLVGGEVIVAANGAPISTWGEFQSLVMASPGRELAIVVRGEEGERALTVTPRLVERPTASGEIEQVGAIGVRLGVTSDQRQVEPVSPLVALQHGAATTWEIVARTAQYVGGIFLLHNTGSDIAGPLGILNASGEVTNMALDSTQSGILAKIGSVALALLQWAAMLSVAVGLANPKDNTVEMYADISGIRKGNKPRQQAELVQEVAIDGKPVIAMVPDYACKFIQSESSKQCISVPMRYGDGIIGAICALRDRSDVIDENEKQAFTLLANSAAIAIENVRLINAQEQQARQNAVSLERQRLASELHDDLIQMLNLINLRIGQIRGSLLEDPGRDFQKEFDLVSVLRNLLQENSF